MRFYGTVGFAETIDAGSGVWEEQITERKYYGDVLRDTKQTESADKVNFNLNISNSFSIVADPYAREHFSKILFVEWMGAKWKVSSVENRNPRLILQVSGVYNE